MKLALSAVLLLVLSAFAGCGGGPEPIRFGEDACDNCRMIISDRHFGAELVTRKGKAYKFDDISCLWKYKTRHNISDDALSAQLVIAYNKPGTLIDADAACFLQSPAIKSPMAGQVAAFGDAGDCSKMKKKWTAGQHNWAATAALFD